MNNLSILKTNQIELEKNFNYPDRKNTREASFSTCYNVPVKNIVFNHVDNQPREETKDINHFEDTKCSILAKGLEHPVVVSVDKNGVITLESGHHRTSAFQDLEIEMIPAYIVTYNGSNEREVNINRAEFLQDDNHHLPVKPMSQKAGEKYLFKLKRLGLFVGLEESEIKALALKKIKKHYTHLGESKKKAVVTNFMKNIVPPSYRTYSNADRQEFGKKHRYTVKSTKYDFNHKCFYINATASNCLKSIATIDKFADPPEGVDSTSIHVFCNTGSKDLASSKSNRAEFRAKMLVANKNYARFQVEKIYFLPDLVSQFDCEIYEWTLDENGTGSFKKL
jgi:hypothetical protein